MNILTHSPLATLNRGKRNSHTERQNSSQTRLKWRHRSKVSTTNKQQDIKSVL